MKVLLTTLHSKYIHASLALPCIASSCSDLDSADVRIKEYTINESLHTVLSNILEIDADIIGFSCYIWNIEKTLHLISEIKINNPHIFIILGGPEVSYDAEEVLRKNSDVDCVVKGEGEASFRALLERIGTEVKRDSISHSMEGISGICFRKGGRIIDNGMADPMADLDWIPSPFQLKLVETSKPLVYYESSRGCPFTCAFCLSSLDSNVRSFSMERIRQDLLKLMNDDIKQIKFVDRTFNYNVTRANEIWAFILEQNKGSHCHFEIAADLLTDENIQLLKNVPTETFRFEIGVQSLAEETLEKVNRKSDVLKLFSNVKRLLEETDIHIHLDLVAGLPGEDFLGFLASLERLFLARPHHIQVEPLKVLKGSPMQTIAEKEGYRYNGHPPYNILRTPWLSNSAIKLIEIIGRLLELVYNSGRFKNSLNVLSELISLSEFFAGLARYWESEEITTLSMEMLFEVIWQYEKKILNDDELDQMADALSYDRCLVDYPFKKGLPDYMSQEAGSCRVSREEIDAIREKFRIDPDTRVRCFRYHFKRDYGFGAGDLVFIYHSVSGKKQELFINTYSQILEVNDKPGQLDP